MLSLDYLMGSGPHEAFDGFSWVAGTFGVEMERASGLELYPVIPLVAPCPNIANPFGWQLTAQPSTQHINGESVGGFGGRGNSKLVGGQQAR